MQPQTELILNDVLTNHLIIIKLAKHNNKLPDDGLLNRNL